METYIIYLQIRRNNYTKKFVIIRLQTLVVKTVPLPHCYHELEMAGMIFHYHQYFLLKKQCHNIVSLIKE